MRRRARALVLVGSAVVMMLSSCAGGDDDDALPSGSVVPGTTGATSSSGAPTTTIAEATPGLPVVVDTDLAADDIVALAYLTSLPRVDLLAVTVSGTGEVRCPRGADVARGLLARIGREVPVACGQTTPLTGDRTFPEPWRDGADNAYGLMLEMVTPPEDEPSAVELLVSTITSSSRPVVLLTLGPLTNIAAALAAEPDIASNIARVVIMGGAVDVPGNVQPEGATDPLAAEWNLYVDPAAAAAVIESGVPVTLVGLDATNYVPVTDDVIEQLAANDRTEATKTVRQLFELRPPPYLWDPLAAIAVTDPALVPTRAVAVAVVTEGVDAGQTVAAAGGATIDVAGAPDAAAVITHLLRTLAAVPVEEELVVPTTLPVLGSLTVAFDGQACSFDGPTSLDGGAYTVTAEPGPVPYWAVIAHLAGEATLEEALAWAAEHPNEEPPMVDAVTMIGEGAETSPARVVFDPGNVGILCGTPDNTIVPAAQVVVSD